MGLRNQNCQGILDILTSVWTKYILQKNLGPECFPGRKILRFVHSYICYLFSFPGMPFPLVLIQLDFCKTTLLLCSGKYFNGANYQP